MSDDRFEAWYREFTARWGQPGYGYAPTNRERLLAREAWNQAEHAAGNASRDAERGRVLAMLHRLRAKAVAMEREGDDWASWQALDAAIRYVDGNTAVALAADLGAVRREGLSEQDSKLIDSWRCPTCGATADEGCTYVDCEQGDER